MVDFSMWGVSIYPTHVFLRPMVTIDSRLWCKNVDRFLHPPTMGRADTRWASYGFEM